MTTDRTPKKRHKLWRYLIIGALAVGMYVAVILTFFRTPKASHWIDDDTYGNTKYFHFRSGKDAWNESLPLEPPQTVEDSYRLAIVEVDEFGDFFQSEKYKGRPEDYQLLCAKEMLVKAGSANKKPVLLFLLVHGWRNDASKEDETLTAFKMLLTRLAQSGWSRDYNSCGVYIGWRGASVKHGWFAFPAEILSFWGRKTVAEKISSTCASTAIFGLIDTARKVASDPEAKPSRIVLAGHSLGAGILMNSVSQALAYKFARANSEKVDSGGPVVLESPADLILLLNPAVESVYLRQLRTSMQPIIRTNVYPWLVSLSSETDRVNKILFPIAQWRVGSNARETPYFEVDRRNYKAQS